MNTSVNQFINNNNPYIRSITNTLISATSDKFYGNDNPLEDLGTLFVSSSNYPFNLFCDLVDFDGKLFTHWCLWVNELITNRREKDGKYLKVDDHSHPQMLIRCLSVTDTGCLIEYRYELEFQFYHSNVELIYTIKEDVMKIILEKLLNAGVIPYNACGNQVRLC
jgi:hypothetical protein